MWEAIPAAGWSFSLAVSEEPTAALTSPVGQGTEGLGGRSEPGPPRLRPPFPSSLQLTLLVVQVSILYYGGHLVISGQMTSGNLISFIIYEFVLGDCMEVRGWLGEGGPGEKGEGGERDLNGGAPGFTGGGISF